MAQNYKDRTVGRDVVALLFDETIVEGDGTTTIGKGHLFAILERAEENSVLGDGSLFENVAIGRPVLAEADLVLATGDKVVDLGDPFEKYKTGELAGTLKHLVGYARSKSINYSKTSTDMTVDQDEYTYNVVDELVAISGDINGYKLNVNPTESATFKIENMFIDETVREDTGYKTYGKTNPIVVLGLLYHKTVGENNMAEMDVVPAQFTSMGDSADYGSATTRNLSWQGVARSDAGVIPGKTHIKVPAAA